MEYSKKFPLRSDGIVLGIDFKKKFSKLDDFRRIDELATRLKKVDGVAEVNAITSIRLPEKSVFGIQNRTLISLKSEVLFKKHFKKLKEYPDVTPKFISTDGKATCLYLRLEGKDKGEILKRIRGQVNKSDFPAVHYSGSAVLESLGKDQFIYETAFLSGLGALLLVLLFLVLFRDFRSLCVMILVIGFNVSCVLLAFWFFSYSIGVLTLTVPLLIITLSFCDIVHVLYAYKSQPDTDASEDRLKRSLSSLHKSIWLTSLTTFLAFAIFMLSSVQAIVEFGMITCVGILTAYFSAVFVLPVCITLFKVKGFKKTPVLAGISTWLKKFTVVPRRVIEGSLVIISCLAVLAFTSFSIDNTSQKNLGKKMGDGLNFLNERFEGTRSIEVIISSEPSDSIKTNILNVKTLALVNTIEYYLLHEYDCSSVFSVNTAVKRLNRFNHFGVTGFYRLPKNPDSTFFNQLNTRSDVLGLSDAVSSDGKVLKIVGRCKDKGSAKARVSNDELIAFLEKLPLGNSKAFVSGYAYVHDQSMSRVTRLILLGVLLSVLMASLISGIAFKSFRMLIALLLPNILPLLSALVLMQFLGIDLNPFSAMALSILFGLSVDDTIYITSSVMFGKDSLSSSERIYACIERNTFPTMATSLFLVGGFGTLLFSEIEADQNIGVLVSVVLLIALFSDLILLPALLKWALEKGK